MLLICWVYAVANRFFCIHNPPWDRSGSTFHTVLRTYFCDVALPFPVNVLN
jgi:hypothetical protein